MGRQEHEDLQTSCSQDGSQGRGVEVHLRKECSVGGLQEDRGMGGLQRREYSIDSTTQRVLSPVLH